MGEPSTPLCMISGFGRVLEARNQYDLLLRPEDILKNPIKCIIIAENNSCVNLNISETFLENIGNIGAGKSRRSV